MKALFASLDLLLRAVKQEAFKLVFWSPLEILLGPLLMGFQSQDPSDCKSLRFQKRPGLLDAGF